MSHCSQCGTEFSCAMVDTTSAQACWCTALPRAAMTSVLLDANGSAKTCMCAACLSRLRALGSKPVQRRLSKLSSPLPDWHTHAIPGAENLP